MPAALPAFAPEATARAAATGSVVRRRLRLTADDGFHLAADLFQGAAPARATVLIASAMGVPRRLYAGLAETLAAAGLTTLTLDYRGIGESRPPSLRRLRARLSDWAELDLAAAVRELRGRPPELPLLWLGHPVGGPPPGPLPAPPGHPRPPARPPAGPLRDRPGGGPRAGGRPWGRGGQVAVGFPGRSGRVGRRTPGPQPGGGHGRAGARADVALAGRAPADDARCHAVLAARGKRPGVGCGVPRRPHRWCGADFACH